MSGYVRPDEVRTWEVKARTDLIRLREIRSDHFRSSQIGSGEVRPGQIWLRLLMSDLDKLRQVSSGQVHSGQGQDMSG